MRIASILPLALAASLTASPALAAPASILGKWKTDDAKSVITFYECGTAICGKIDRFLVKEPDGGIRDTKNPDKTKRGEMLLGKRIFWNLTPDGDAFEGKGYSPEEGRYFNADLAREGTKLKVKGCVSVFCRTVTFTRL
ncbi:DUF2147 domain-containing protein [Allopontixanthobacter sp.]|uniref:DUF2147 domain-containing protein n=1 Tax=Allopontixanthobacter sp. TaxID=2906452 RepID=UPI002AB8E1D4|nr:DUF2147 domain-containing protein [Allopontixanthobacter sp.]MDZ4308617.1 DUF2147 domain-containing protein [Allopontixanthobacter sp.]